MADEKDKDFSPRVEVGDMWRHLYVALSSPWVLAVLGAALGALFQGRSWSYQNSVQQIQADTKNVLEIGPKLTGLINERYSAAQQLIKASSDGAAEEAMKTARDRFAASHQEWELRFMDLFSQLKFYVDSPFAVPEENDLKLAADIDCSKYTLSRLPQAPDSSPPFSATFLVAVLNRCFADVEDQVSRAKGGKSGIDPKLRNDSLQGASLRLQHVWHVNYVLHCVIDGRALQIRGAQSRPVSLGTLFLGVGPLNSYDRPSNEQNCLSDYRDDHALGLASLAHE